MGKAPKHGSSDRKADSPPPPAYCNEPPSYGSSSRLSSFSRHFSKDEKRDVKSEKRPRPSAAIVDVDVDVDVDPATLLPPSFRVGKQAIKPLVNVRELVDHLTFLACLDRLQAAVRETPTPGADAEHQIPGDVKWAAFCERASHRFQAWAKTICTLQAASQINELLATVEIDVLMAWHTYMLNPGAYEQDLERLTQLKRLKTLGPFPLSTIVESIDLDSLTYGAGVQTYEALVTFTEADTVLIACPRCEASVNVPLIGRWPVKAGGGGGGGGLATRMFKHECSSCNLSITRSALRAGRFLRDLRELQLQLPDRQTNYLAGIGNIEDGKPPIRTSHALSLAAWWAATPQSYKDTHAAPTTKDVLKPFFGEPMDIVAFGDAYDWSHEQIRQTINEVVRTNALFQSLWDDKLLSWTAVGHRRNMTTAIQRMDKVYNSGTGGFTSIDLGPAMQRQAGFVDSMAGLGWLKVQRWLVGENRFYVLQKAAARYHAFLDLMNAHPFKMVSPTLDIDLAWHTHQLHGAAYGVDTRAVVGRFVDHDDAIVDVLLRDAYDVTSNLWAERFHTAYSGCGCPVPPKTAAKLEEVRKKAKRPSFLKMGSAGGGAAAIASALRDLSISDHVDKDTECASTHNRMKVGAGDPDPSLLVVDKNKNDRDHHSSPFLKPLGRDDGDRVQPDTAHAYWGVALLGPWGPFNEESDAANGNCGTACCTGLYPPASCGGGAGGICGGVPGAGFATRAGCGVAAGSCGGGGS